MPQDFPLLNTIQGPDDVKKLSRESLDLLAQEVRDRIISVVSQNGGHLGPNLGVVELTIALHRVFSTPKDQITFDVAHQGYVHKLLTGRNGPEFDKIRKTGGVCGFLMREESPHDSFGAGHAGTALSAALGMAVARDLAEEKDKHIVAVIGDAAFTCGVTMEAMNNVASNTKAMTIILNDNKWSISKNVGAVARCFNEVITSDAYNFVNKGIGRILKMLPGGAALKRWASKAKKETKDALVSSSFFENYGLRYVGPVDGHNIDELMHYLQFCKESDEPVLLHVITEKGKGCPFALENPEKFHGPGPFDPNTGKSKPGKVGAPPKYQEVFGRTMVRFAKENPKVVGITAATAPGTSLSLLEKECPKQFFDVGIAEEHAVVFAAGLATQGFRPVFGVYSTFLQRGYDQIIHDVCLQRLPVLFCMDRAGLSSVDDGPTHHGVFDISVLRTIPHTVIMQPKDEDELVDMMHTGLQLDDPAFIRYPKGVGQGVSIKDNPSLLRVGKAELLQEGCDLAIWALGPMVQDALILAGQLHETLNISVAVVNARFAKPLDETLLLSQAQQVKLFVSIEDNVVKGGFGSALLETLQEAGMITPVERIGWPDRFIGHASSIDDVRDENGMDIETMKRRIQARWESIVHQAQSVDIH